MCLAISHLYKVAMASCRMNMSVIRRHCSDDVDLREGGAAASVLHSTASAKFNALTCKR